MSVRRLSNPTARVSAGLWYKGAAATLSPSLLPPPPARARARARARLCTLDAPAQVESRARVCAIALAHVGSCTRTCVRACVRACPGRFSPSSARARFTVSPRMLYGGPLGTYLSGLYSSSAKPAVASVGLAGPGPGSGAAIGAGLSRRRAGSRYRSATSSFTTAGSGSGVGVGVGAAVRDAAGDRLPLTGISSTSSYFTPQPRRKYEVSRTRTHTHTCMHPRAQNAVSSRAQAGGQAANQNGQVSRPSVIGRLVGRLHWRQRVFKIRI
ncbi:unnamed protein product [Protopolystoma xenopodis]|uniref:Uncharacterized protein n=1 Tax=Protopolystoma xenopodis TaxID=117903 RepID=A0A448XKD2_9PLAT|nr:unnamed protein product [Protopolystoma xenopodis]